MFSWSDTWISRTNPVLGKGCPSPKKDPSGLQLPPDLPRKRGIPSLRDEWTGEPSSSTPDTRGWSTGTVTPVSPTGPVSTSRRHPSARGPSEELSRSSPVDVLPTVRVTPVRTPTPHTRPFLTRRPGCFSVSVGRCISSVVCYSSGRVVYDVSTYGLRVNKGTRSQWASVGMCGVRWVSGAKVHV